MTSNPTQPKRPRGRPKGTTKPPSEKFTEQIKVMLTPELKAIYDSLGPEWIRERLKEARC